MNDLFKTVEDDERSKRSGFSSVSALLNLKDLCENETLQPVFLVEISLCKLQLFIPVCFCEALLICVFRVSADCLVSCEGSRLGSE